MPQVVQDFGWRRTNFTGGGPGEIGGRVENSRRAGLLRDAAGQAPDLRRRDLRLRQAGPAPHRAAGGGLRRLLQLPAAHLARLDLDGLPRLGGGRPGPGHVRLDVRATGRPAAPRPPSCSQPDGKPHTWSFRYEPEARADPVWHDEALERHITDRTGNGQPYELQGEEHLFERLKKEEPGLTREALHARLLKVRDQGLVEYFHRHDRAPLVEAPRRRQGPRPRHAPVRRRDARTSSGSTRRSGGPRPSSTASACSTSPGSARGWRCTSAT